MGENTRSIWQDQSVFAPDKFRAGANEKALQLRTESGAAAPFPFAAAAGRYPADLFILLPDNDLLYRNIIVYYLQRALQIICKAV